MTIQNAGGVLEELEVGLALGAVDVRISGLGGAAVTLTILVEIDEAGLRIGREAGVSARRILLLVHPVKEFRNWQGVLDTLSGMPNQDAKWRFENEAVTS